MKAILSVFDKTSLVEFASPLVAKGYELISTGGTFRTLAEANLPVQQVADFTGAPEILGGRVKTLHPIFGPSLSRPQSRNSHCSCAMSRVFLNRSVQIRLKRWRNFAHVIFSQVL